MSTEDAPPSIGAYTRDQLRQSYADAWRKHVARSPLTALEALIVDVLVLHPEYHALVQDSPTALAFDSAAGAAQENPFLHMGLHLAIREVHTAEHTLMESLAETLWEAQRSGRAPDEGRYLELARRRLRSLGAR
jgi:uncharacterized heparinase superfamily protein